MRPSTIGILAGSGPEAGLDLWSKVLTANRERLGSEFTGDVDAPRVVVLSEPELGLSMDLAAHEAQLWRVLESAARQLSAAVDVWAIACNTLNYFAPKLDGLGLGAELITPDGCARRFLESSGADRVGLLGALPVAEMAAFSPYQSLQPEIAVEVLPERLRQALHGLIAEVKIAGGALPHHPDRLAEIVAGFSPEVECVLLACTELPLIPLSSERRLVDVTALVAQELVSFR